MGLSWASLSTLSYTAELILCSTICVHSATRHNIQSVSQSIRQPVCQSVSQSLSQSVSQSVNKSASQSVSQSVSKSVNQSVSYSEKRAKTAEALSPTHVNDVTRRRGTKRNKFYFEGCELFLSHRKGTRHACEPHNISPVTVFHQV